MSVCFFEPWSNGLMSWACPSGLIQTFRSRPCSRQIAIAELDHLPELPGRVDVQQREGQPAGVERLLRQPQHDGGVLADRVEHHRPLELGGHLADDVDALGLEHFQMGQVVTAADHPPSCLVSLLSIL